MDTGRYPLTTDLIHVELGTCWVLLFLPSTSQRRFERIFGGFVWELGFIAKNLDSDWY